MAEGAYKAIQEIMKKRFSREICQSVFLLSVFDDKLFNERDKSVHNGGE